MRPIIFALLGLSHLATASPVCLHQRHECELLGRWYAGGTAAGNHSDYYDNRDRGHSRIQLKQYPQFKEVEYSDRDRERNLDWAAQWQILPHITLGNSSTAAGVKRGGSNVRQVYYTNPKGMNFLYSQYRTGNLYIYPEHRDHDPGRNATPGYGDLFPTNSPYVILSQGSSGSDRPFLDAFAHTLAAFRPEVKSWLKSIGLLMPTLQQIFRSTQKGTTYLSGDAHPSVFTKEKLDTVAMVKAAHAITVQTIPPMVQLEVVEEDDISSSLFPVESEVLCDTPCTIARIHRRSDYVKRLIVSARKSYDIGGRPLTYKWVVLRGDPEKISIEEKERGIAEIKIGYHPWRPIAEGSDLGSNRVDIGVFVSNGRKYSAPGFITVYTLDNELRTYSNGKLKEIQFEASTLDFTISDWKAALEELPAIGCFEENELEMVADLQAEWTALYEAQLEAEAEFSERDRLKKINPKNKEVAGEARKTKKALDAAKKATEEVLERTVADFDGDSIKQRLRRHIEIQLHDPTLYQTKWSDHSYQRYRLPIANLEDAPLHGHKRYLIERMNLAILEKEVYPTFLKAVDRFNYVDTRLTTPSSKRLSF